MAKTEKKVVLEAQKKRAKERRAAAKKRMEAMSAFYVRNKASIISGAVLLVLLVLFPVVLWLAGALYLKLYHMNPLKADVWTWIDSWQVYGGDHAKQLKCLAGSAVVIYVLLPALGAMGFNKARALHGSARFANSVEVRKAKLLDEEGILIGKYNGKLMRFPGQQFVILAAPTRSGKGVGIVIPNCLSYEDSLMVLDIKQENYNLTAGYRKDVLGQEVYLFNPFAEEIDQANNKPAPRTHRYNPLSSISRGVHRIGDILSIGNAIWPRTGSKEDFWNDNARNLFLAIVLFLSELRDRRAEIGDYSDGPQAKEELKKLPNYAVTIGEVLRQSSGRGSGLPVKKYLESVVKEYREWLSSECLDAMGNFLSSSDDVLASILSTFNAPLTIWRNPIVDCATSANDFDLRDVRKKRMTVYIGITPDHLPDAALLVNLLFSQLVNLNTKQLPIDNHDGPDGASILKYACLLLMDEFTAIGKVNIIAKAVSYIAGYNLRLLPIIQSVAQLESVYGREDARTFVTNHALQIVYAPREQKDANEYSEMLGYLTVKSASISRSRGLMGKGGGPSESVSDQRRALLLPQELRELGQDKEIIFLENCKPILCEKIFYYKDEEFKDRLLPAPFVASLDIETFMARNQGRVRDLADSECDFEKEELIPPINVEMMECAERFPAPPIEPFDDEDSLDYVKDVAVSLGMSRETVDQLAPDVASLEESLKFRDLVAQSDLELHDLSAPVVLVPLPEKNAGGNSISFSDDDLDNAFEHADEDEFAQVG